MKKIEKISKADKMKSMKILGSSSYKHIINYFYTDNPLFFHHHLDSLK